VSRRLAPPSGMAPPVTAISPLGEKLDLAALATEACRAYDAEFPDERDRYGPAGIQWCVHDNQHVFNWAALSLTGHLVFLEQIQWLAGVLEARDFPLDRLARSLELCAQTIKRRHPDERALAERLRDGATFVRSRPSFRS
jgi:hypothetical protein